MRQMKGKKESENIQEGKWGVERRENVVRGSTEELPKLVPPVLFQK